MGKKMSELSIVKESRGNGGRYATKLDGIEAELTFSWVSDSVMNAGYTGVPAAIGGRGVARQLVDFMIKDARRSGFKIIPSCSYIEAQFRRHPEWADLRA